MRNAQHEPDVTRAEVQTPRQLAGRLSCGDARLLLCGGGSLPIRVTSQGRAALKRETRDWQQQQAAIARILKASPPGAR